MGVMLKVTWCVRSDVKSPICVSEDRPVNSRGKTDAHGVDMRGSLL